MANVHAPAPWSYETSGKPGGNGDFNLYVIDKNKRKIGAVWGRRGEKEATAAMMIAAPDIVEAAKMIRAIWTPGFPIDGDLMQKLFEAIELTEGTA